LLLNRSQDATVS